MADWVFEMHPHDIDIKRKFAVRNTKKIVM